MTTPRVVFENRYGEPPKLNYDVGYLKGKSAIHIARACGGKQWNFVGEHFGRDLATLGLPTPTPMQGQNFIPLINDPKVCVEWRNEMFIQVGQSETTRALRTPDWAYVALAPDA